MTDEELLAGAKRLRQWIRDTYGSCTQHSYWDVIFDAECHGKHEPGAVLSRDEIVPVLRECLAKLEGSGI